MRIDEHDQKDKENREVTRSGRIFPSSFIKSTNFTGFRCEIMHIRFEWRKELERRLEGN